VGALAPGAKPLFKTFIIVDWSAANQPKTGADSIWVCRKNPTGEILFNPPTRWAARSLLAELLADAVARGERILLGCDFPFGYPAGFASRLGLPGVPWRAVWDKIAALIKDDERNRNNRFTVAIALNRLVSNGTFPFWACPAAQAGPHLGMKHHRLHAEHGLAERRIIDTYVPSTQPCWKLLGTGSVGGQALTGIPVVRALRDDPRWSTAARVWPFETGLRPNPDAAIVMAEVYPSLWRIVPGPNEPKDAAQVRDVARFLAGRNAAGTLAPLFAADPNLTPAQRAIVETEEAWTLGVIAPKPVRERATLASAASLC
jgi:precorrin-8X/cobalt-precorrin-8 methylmutase